MTFSNAALRFSRHLPGLLLVAMVSGCLQAQIVDRRPSSQAAQDATDDERVCPSGCGSDIEEPSLDAEGPESDDSSDEPATGSGAPGLSVAVPWAVYDGGSTTGDTAPDTLLLVFGSAPGATCQEPFGGDYPCESWKVWFTLPRSLQEVGQSVALNDPRIRSGWSDMGVADEVGTCGGGGGSLEAGTIEVLSLDDTQVRIRVKDLMDFASFTHPDINGDYEIPLCASPSAP